MHSLHLSLHCCKRAPILATELRRGGMSGFGTGFSIFMVLLGISFSSSRCKGFLVDKWTFLQLKLGASLVFPCLILIWVYISGSRWVIDMYFSPFLYVPDGALSLRRCFLGLNCSYALPLEDTCQILPCSSCCFLLLSSAYTFFPVLGVFQLNEFAYISVPTTALPASELTSFSLVCKLL